MCLKKQLWFVATGLGILLTQEYTTPDSVIHDRSKLQSRHLHACIIAVNTREIRCIIEWYIENHVQRVRLNPSLFTVVGFQTTIVF